MSVLWEVGQSVSVLWEMERECERVVGIGTESVVVFREVDRECERVLECGTESMSVLSPCCERQADSLLPSCC